MNTEQAFTASSFMYLCEDFIRAQCHDTHTALPKKGLYLSPLLVSCAS